MLMLADSRADINERARALLSNHLLYFCNAFTCIDTGPGGRVAEVLIGSLPQSSSATTRTTSQCGTTCGFEAGEASDVSFGG